MGIRLNDQSRKVLAHLRSKPGGAPEGMTHLKMYEHGLDHMIEVNTEMGCVAFKLAAPEERQAISAAALVHFDTQEIRFLLTAAVDRLAELALDGLPVYREQEPLE